MIIKNLNPFVFSQKERRSMEHKVWYFQRENTLIKESFPCLKAFLFKNFFTYKLKNKECKNLFIDFVLIFIQKIRKQIKRIICVTKLHTSTVEKLCVENCVPPALLAFSHLLEVITPLWPDVPLLLHFFHPTAFMPLHQTNCLQEDFIHCLTRQTVRKLFG